VILFISSLYNDFFFAGNLALNYVGYDLPKTAIDQLWSNNMREFLGINL